MGFEIDFEMVVRKVFQCDRLRDPLGLLSFYKNWAGLYSEEFSEKYRCMAWAVLCRLQNEYLRNFDERKDLYAQSVRIEQKVLNAKTNKQIIDAMREIEAMVNLLCLTEDPHFDYTNTNDNIKYFSLI